MTRLRTISVLLTEGDTPSDVFMRPCTIHGWRPFSVSIQPAVFITSGAAAAQVATHRNTRAWGSRPRHHSHTPHSASRAASEPRYAITRIDQYWTKTFGT